MDKWDGEPFFERLGLRPDASVLEIGVGTGRLARRALHNGCGSFVGCDLSEKALGRAKENLRGFQNVRLVCGDFLQIQFDELFDIVYCSLVLFHIQNKAAALQKTRALLKSGGRFVASLDKGTSDRLVYGDHEVILYPDRLDETIALLRAAGFIVGDIYETEFAHIVLAYAP